MVRFSVVLIYCITFSCGTDKKYAFSTKDIFTIFSDIGKKQKKKGLEQMDLLPIIWYTILVGIV